MRIKVDEDVSIAVDVEERQIVLYIEGSSTQFLRAVVRLTTGNAHTLRALLKAGIVDVDSRARTIVERKGPPV